MLEFNETNHTYTFDGKVLISTTQLMIKHNLSPNYDKVNPEVLQSKAKKGTLIHKEIENFIKENQLGFTDELYEFQKYVKEHNLTSIKSETMVCNDIVAGTIDLMFMENDRPIIADIKTTSVVHKEAVSWQLSIYRYLYLSYVDGNIVPVKESEYNDVSGQVFHFNKEGILNVEEIPLKPYSDIERLFNCERLGMQFTLEIDEYENSLQNVVHLEKIINELNEKVEFAKKQQEEFKKSLMEAMENRKLSTFEKDGIKITLVKGKSKKEEILEDEMNKEIVEAYKNAKVKYDEEAKSHTKVTQVDRKPYLRITIKENNNE